MELKDKLNSDLKAALLAGDRLKSDTIKGIKAAVLNEEISQGVRDKGLSDEDIQKVLARESKKRAEAIEMYKNGGAQDRADAESAEKAVIDAYLPEQIDETKIAEVVNTKIAEMGASAPADMGKVIGAVKSQLGASADGATIAKLVKEKLGA